jgi:hypothetical protein
VIVFQTEYSDVYSMMEVAMKIGTVFLTTLLFLLLSLTLGCSKGPDYRVDSLKITSVERSFPDKDDWLHVVEGTVSVLFRDNPTKELLEKVRGEVGIALYVYTKGNPNPMYFFQYVSGEPNTSRIATPYLFEKSSRENLYTAGWELTDIYFGDEEFNDLKYDAIALAGDREALESLTEHMSTESLLNLPNELDARLVFSLPFEVERESTAPNADTLYFRDEETVD